MNFEPAGKTQGQGGKRAGTIEPSTFPSFQERVIPFMKKIKILSGSASLLLLIYGLCIEIGCILLCFFADVENVLVYILLVFWSIIFGVMLMVYNRIVTIVTYDPEKEIVTRRGLFWGFYRELRVADIIRTEVRIIPKEQEYILLVDKEEKQYFESLSPDMPIRVPNTAKGRNFVANFYNP